MIRLIISYDAVYVEVREHAARTVGDLEGRRRGVTTEYPGCFLESCGGSSISEQRRNVAGWKYNGKQSQGISLRHRFLRWYVVLLVSFSELLLTIHARMLNSFNKKIK